MSLSEDGFTALIPINEVALEMFPQIAVFSCGSQSLDAFLHENAKDLHCDHLGHTSLLFHQDFEGVVGYITLANDSIQLRISEVGYLGLAYKFELSAYPAVKIGRLGVHQSLQAAGIGTRIMRHWGARWCAGSYYGAFDDYRCRQRPQSNKFL